MPVAADIWAAWPARLTKISAPRSLQRTDFCLIVHAHEYLDLTPEQRSEENEIARAHKIDLIYATPPEKFYCDYIAFATKHGKAVRVPVSGRKHRARV